MRDSDIFDLLEKKSPHELSKEDISILQNELSVEEIEQCSEFIANFKSLDKAILPDPSIKKSLIRKFNSQNADSEIGKNKSFTFMKIAATGAIVIGLSLCFYLLFPQKSTLQETQISLEEFNESTQIEDLDQKESQPLNEDTKYLMNMEFFSNSHLTD